MALRVRVIANITPLPIAPVHAASVPTPGLIVQFLQPSLLLGLAKISHDNASSQVNKKIEPCVSTEPLPSI